MLFHLIKDDQGEEHLVVVTPEQFHEANEISEFLDDALRMEDLLIDRIEEIVAVGAPRSLL